MQLVSGDLSSEFYAIVSSTVASIVENRLSVLSGIIT